MAFDSVKHRIDHEVLCVPGMVTGAQSTLSEKFGEQRLKSWEWTCYPRAHCRKARVSNGEISSH